MKHKYEESKNEKCRIKREYAEIACEIKECINMFKNADKYRISKLNERIGFLKLENNQLEKNLKRVQVEMDSLAKTYGINWLSSMLEYCEFVFEYTFLHGWTAKFFTYSQANIR